MSFQDGGVPALFAGCSGTIREIGQLTIIDHPVQGLVGDVHLGHEILHSHENHISISALAHTTSTSLDRWQTC